MIAAAGYARQALTIGGAAGAVLLGTTVLTFGGWVWGGALVAFFVASTLLSRFGARRKASLSEKFAKWGKRDLGQTLANGGLAGVLAIAAGIIGRQSAYYPALAFAYYGALAAVNADTWATELGVLSHRSPRMITDGKVVPVGSSGAITREGTLAALGGASFIGVIVFLLIQGAALLTMGSWLLSDWIVIPVAILGGMAGSFADSWLGAKCQAIFYCASCSTETEQSVHRCGQRTRHERGFVWMNNDIVNFLASLAGALVASLTGMLLWTQL